MKAIGNVVAWTAALMTGTLAQAATVDFPSAAGDIAISGEGGWTASFPGASDLARFIHANGTYSASKDVEFGSIYVSKSATFNLHTGGDHTVKLANFAVAVDGQTGTLNGGVWDISGTTSGTANNEVGAFGPCNIYGTARTKLVMANGCVVTNVNRLIVSNGGAGNSVAITGQSRVYAKEAYLDYRAGAANGLLEVSAGSELNVSYKFRVGSNSTASGNRARFSDGARFSLYDVRVGEGGAGENVLEICGSATKGKFSPATYVGGHEKASSGNVLVVSNADLSCSTVYVSSNAGSFSNAFYIIGADTSFTATVNSLPRYPFVRRGYGNTFEMDGAEWNYWNTMQLDEASSSNAIRFVNGAKMNMVGGLLSGTNHIASCGNRMYLGNGARLSAAFAFISRADNVITVSNATLATSAVTDSWSGIRIGSTLQNVDVAGINGNGLVIQGNAPIVSSAREVSFKNRSFLRVEVPAEGYGTECVPVTARNAIWDDTSSLTVEVTRLRGLAGSHTLVSTTHGITIPGTVFDAANGSLAARTGGMARLVLANGNRDIVLNVSRGICVSFR